MRDAIFIMERLIFIIGDVSCIMEFIFIMEDAIFIMEKSIFHYGYAIIIIQSPKGKNVRFGTRAFQLASEPAGF